MRGLGPRSEALLSSLGIDTPDALHTLGAVGPMSGSFAEATV
jgi:hypothetical protein